MISEKEFEKLVESCKDDLNLGQNLESLQVKYLGRKGLFNDLVKDLPSLSIEDKKKIGPLANKTKFELERLLADNTKNNAEIDLTAPLPLKACGYAHPVQQMIDNLYQTFREIGFSQFTTPDIETEFDNFDSLRVAKDHPARDMQDTFWTTDGHVLRTQTTAFQNRVLKQFKPPFAVMQAGRVFRAEAEDATHLSALHQFDIFAVTEDLTFANLRGVLFYAMKKIFGEDTEVRFRPSFFPFVEPGAEIDISCGKCKGKGCSACGHKGWLELLGCGMTHPEILENAGLDSKKYHGIAFGVGIERLCMAKYGITDIREMTKNDPKFLSQSLYQTTLE